MAGGERERRRERRQRAPGVYLGDVQVREQRGRELWLWRRDRREGRRGLGGGRQRHQRRGRRRLRARWREYRGDRRRLRGDGRRGQRGERRRRARGERERRRRRVERAPGLQLRNVADRQLWRGAAGLGIGHRRPRRSGDGERRERDERGRRVDAAGLRRERGDERRVGPGQDRRGHRGERRRDPHLERKCGRDRRQRRAQVRLGVLERWQQRADLRPSRRKSA